MKLLTFKKDTVEKTRQARAGGEWLVVQRPDRGPRPEPRRSRKATAPRERTAGVDTPAKTSKCQWAHGKLSRSGKRNAVPLHPLPRMANLQVMPAPSVGNAAEQVILYTTQGLKMVATLENSLAAS